MNIYLYFSILVEFILHLNSNTKLNLKWNKNNPKETEKRHFGKGGACHIDAGRPFGPGWVLFCPGCLIRDKRIALAVPVRKPGQ